MALMESGNMRLKVCVRLRPTPDGFPSLVHSDHRVLYMKDPLRGHSSEFVFDNVFNAEARQEAVFNEVGMPLVEHILQGYNACCLAYGHTGSGKTYSMLGIEPSVGSGTDRLPPLDRNEYGIIPRACEVISKAALSANRKADHVESSGHGGNAVRIKLFVSFMEVYMENVRDLGAAAQAYLKQQGIQGGVCGGVSDSHSQGPGHGHGGFPLPSFPSSDGGPPAPSPSRSSVIPLRDPTDYVRSCLDVMEDAYGITFVKDLTFVEVETAADMISLLQAGYAVRHMCPIDVSSRAHTIFSISVVTYRGNQQPVTSRLNLVDLAGCEKKSRSGPEGHRLREASAVGKSLTALNKVVVALSQAGNSGGAPVTAQSSLAARNLSLSSLMSGGGAVHVPYRDAKLTRVLKDSLGGNSALVFLGCVFPIFDEVDESLATLQYTTKILTNLTAPSVHVLTASGGGTTATIDPGVVEELTAQVSQLKDELEVTHAHYQKLLESIAGPSWRTDPGPVERAPGAAAATSASFIGDGSTPFAAPGLDSFASALSPLAKPAASGGAVSHVSAAVPSPVASGLANRVNTQMGDSDRDQRRSMATEEGLRNRLTNSGDAGRSGGGGGAASGIGLTRPPVQSMAGTGTTPNTNSRISVLEAQIRKLESQVNQARTSAQQVEERLSARKEEMEQVRERMAGKEHAQFAEIKRLRGQVTDLTKALDAERAESTHKLDEAKRRADEECARLMRDIDTLRQQLAQVTGTVGTLVEKHSAAITAEKRQREAVKKQATQLLQQQFVRGSEEHRAQIENLKQQSTYFLSRRVDELTEVKEQMDTARTSYAAEKDALLTELDYLATYSERVTELVRRMEAGVVPVTERGHGAKVFRLPQRERPPRLDGSRLAVLKERSLELYNKLMALSAATATGGGSSTVNGSTSPGNASSAATATVGASGPAAAVGGLQPLSTSSVDPTLGSWMSSGGGALGVVVHGNANGHNPLGSSVDLDALRAQVEAEMKAQVTAQVVGDMGSEKVVEYMRALESAVTRCRQELQAEKKRGAEMAVALRSVQRQHQRPQSPINKAIAAHSPAGTIKLAPSWGLGHTTSLSSGSMRAATAGATSGPLGGVTTPGNLSFSGGSGGGGGWGVASRPATAGLMPLAELSTSGNGRASVQSPVVSGRASGGIPRTQSVAVIPPATPSPPAPA